MSTKKVAKKSTKIVKLPSVKEKLPPVIDEPVVRKALFDLAMLVSRLVALANKELDANEKGVLGPLATLGKVLEEATTREEASAPVLVTKSTVIEPLLGLDVKAILEDKPTRRMRKTIAGHAAGHDGRTTAPVGAPPDLE